VIGIGAYQGSTDKKMWTVLFAQPCSGGGATPKPSTPKPATPKPATPRPATPRPATPPPNNPVATPVPTPEATPEPTPEPTPEATPEPTPDPQFEVDEDSDAFVPAWMWGPLPTQPTLSGTSPTPTPTQPTDAAVDRGLRVADPPVAQGLFESIVGSVASIFFGS
jgi:hypothetical protein